MQTKQGKLVRPEPTRSALRIWIQGILAISATVLMWSISYLSVSLAGIVDIPNIGDLSALLFGASSVALFLFSILFAILAIIGWNNIDKRLRHVDQLERDVRNELEHLGEILQTRVTTLEKDLRHEAEQLEAGRIRPLEKEMMGRVHSTLGYALGEMSIDRNSLTVTERAKMREAVDLCQMGFDFLRETGEIDSPGEFMALNNLIFYSCIINDLERRTFLLEQARRMRTKAQARGATNLMLTSYRAILQFGGNEEEKREAINALAKLATQSDISDAQRKEASLHLALFSALK